jgi:hypothetical protein
MTALPATLADYRRLLAPDQWRQRKENKFSDDIATVNEVLHDPFASDPQRSDVLESWLSGRENQPCLFGRIAAKKDGISFCFLTTEDILSSDEHIRAKIAAKRRLWKQRALRGEPRHGFMLVVCDPKVCKANPDQMLYQFALHLQRLAGWPSKPECRGNDIVFEWLYLRNSKTGDIAKFTFSVDFFAAAGDRRMTTGSLAASRSPPTAWATWSGTRSGTAARRTRPSGLFGPRC